MCLPSYQSMHSNCTKPTPMDREFWLACIHSSVLILCTPVHSVPSAVKSGSTQMHSPAEGCSFFPLPSNFPLSWFPWVLLACTGAPTGFPTIMPCQNQPERLQQTWGLAEWAGTMARWAFWCKAPFHGGQEALQLACYSGWSMGNKLLVIS